MAWSAERIKGWISCPHHSPWQRGIPSLDLWASLHQAFGDLIQDGLECRKNQGVDCSPPPFTMAERNSKFRFVGFLDQAFGDLIQDGLECRKNQGVDFSLPPFTMAERNSKFRFVGFLDQAFGDLIQDGLERRKNQGVFLAPTIHHGREEFQV